ncbi:MAG: SH3 domain-containing protein, partial [Coprobacillus sp.]
TDGYTAVNENVTAKSETNLRDKPSMDGSQVVYTLKNGEYVKRIGINNNGWSKLEYNGKTVYAISSYLEKQ